MFGRGKRGEAPADPRNVVPPRGGSGTAKPALPRGGSSHQPVEYEYRYALAWYRSVKNADNKVNNDEWLTGLLKDGWQPVRETPMGASGDWQGGVMGALCVLRRPKKAA